MLNLPLKAGAGIGECSVVMLHAPRSFPPGHGSALFLALIKMGVLRKMSLNYALGLLMYSCRFCS